ncbi:MAG TPA: STAS domain-containing protein [Gemmataceae bacterium]|nr:STAS domain-containing protein [Gemmataceae bacterium]
MTPSPYRHLTARTERGVLVLTITEAKIQGEDVAATLRQEMLQAVESTACNRVVIDFQHAQYISSAAFRPLLTLRRKLQEQGGRVMLCSLSPVIGDIFYTTRMIGDDGSITRVFEVERDAESAVARLAAEIANHETHEKHETNSAQEP